MTKRKDLQGSIPQCWTVTSEVPTDKIATSMCTLYVYKHAQHQLGGILLFLVLYLKSRTAGLVGWLVGWLVGIEGPLSESLKHK